MKHILYVADDIQPLASGKLLTVGLYPDAVIMMHMPPDAPTVSLDAPAGMATLCLLLTVTGLPLGDSLYEGTLLLPDGATSTPAAPLQHVSVNGQDPVNVIHKFAPFLVPQIGTYTLISKFKDVELRSTFEVRRGVPLTST